ncbi:hypothetical protein [Desulfuribacillus alkaliarsenatis]|uniref:Uncharacterized protein n=1 Tax=Desulfuribacillus alkaliarsenatis TaxID=766136 RepID=A0A1E5G2G6_9FIRM|nr:hypothetical protein [Desulfuribacillus alkaliarsenatis]OEF97134.1 hypothetical protein BHF68_05935 [Desulfuribacillus alkaliarsenatis]
MIARKYTWQVLVHTESRLDQWSTDYFAGLSLRNDKGITILSGELPDISAVYGLILQLRDIGIGLITLQVQKKERGR